MRARQTQLVQKAALNPVAFLSQLINDNVITESTEEAKKDKKGYEATQTKYRSLGENIFWELVDNQGIKPIGSHGHIALSCGPVGGKLKYIERILA